VGNSVKGFCDSLLDLSQYKCSKSKLRNTIKRHELRPASPVSKHRVNRPACTEGCWRPCWQQQAGKESEAPLNLVLDCLSSAKPVQELKRFLLARAQLRLRAAAHV